MSGPIEFVDSIYLGDRGLKAIVIDGWEGRVSFRVDLLSRVRPGTNSWDFYNEGDICDGRIVLTGVRSVRFEPPGPLPNDFITSFRAKRVETDQTAETAIHLYVFEMTVSSIAPDGTSQEVEIQVVASGVHLEDPSRPDVEIRE